MKFIILHLTFCAVPLTVPLGTEGMVWLGHTPD